MHGVHFVKVLYTFFFAGGIHSLSWHRKGEKNQNGRYFARIWTPQRPINDSGQSSYQDP